MKELFKDKGFQRLLVIFILVTAVGLIFRQTLAENKVDPVVVLAGNLIIFFASTLTLLLYGRAKNAKTSHGFSRNVYAAFVTKFFILVTAAMVYFYFSSNCICIIVEKRRFLFNFFLYGFRLVCICFWKLNKPSRVYKNQKKKKFFIFVILLLITYHENWAYILWLLNELKSI